MSIHYFLVAVEDKDIKDARFKPRRGAALAGWRLFNDLAYHLGPEAEPYPHIKGVYRADPVMYGRFDRGPEVTDG